MSKLNTIVVHSEKEKQTIKEKLINQRGNKNNLLKLNANNTLECQYSKLKLEVTPREEIKSLFTTANFLKIKNIQEINIDEKNFTKINSDIQSVVFNINIESEDCKFGPFEFSKNINKITLEEYDNKYTLYIKNDLENISISGNENYIKEIYDCLVKNI